MVKNLKDLFAKFADETVCREHLIKQRWPDGVVKCQYCGHTKCYRIENGERFKCANNKCYKRFRVTVGTIFEASNIPLSTWFPAMYLILSHKKGISSIQLGKDLGVTQKTAWFMLHRIRQQLKADSSTLLGGTVEIDETYIGGKVGNMSKSKRAKIKNSQSPLLKTPVLSMLQRDGKVVSHVLPTVNRDTVLPIINETLQPDTNIMTDSSHIYTPLAGAYQHGVVNHEANEYVNGAIHTNSVEGYFGLFKRMIYGIYHQVSVKHLQRYVDEHNFRYNSRKEKDGFRFTEALCNVEGRLTYKTLVNTPLLTWQAPTLSQPNYVIVSGRKTTPVYQLQYGKIIAEYPTIRKAAEMTGINKRSILGVLKGRKKTTGGYSWQYA